MSNKACRLVAAVQGMLAATHRSVSSAVVAVPPGTIIESVIPIATLLAPTVDARAALLSEALTQLETRFDINCACTVAAFLAAGIAADGNAPRAAADDAEHARRLCRSLWDTLVTHQSAANEVDAAAQCVSRLFPAYGEIIVDAAVESVVTTGDSCPMPVHSAIEVMGFVSSALVERSSESWVATHAGRFVGAALRCVGNVQSSPTTVPTITRRVLIPLMRDASAAAVEGTRARSIDLVRQFQEAGMLSEAVVLMAALFDFFFPSASANGSGDAKKAKKTNPSAVAPTIPRESDLRYAPFVWQLLLTGLESSGLRVATQGGPTSVAGLHLQVIYLLKRLVSYTKETEGLAPSPINFHTSFVWRGRDSDKAWDQFFLVFDSLNEYGLHIVSPALERIATLIETAASGAISMSWVEVLIDKAINHPNVGVRKLGLGCLWTAPMGVVVTDFSERLVCGAAYLAACDPRICTETDKVQMPGSFLDCKAFNGKPCHSLPRIQNVAERFEQFYTAYLLRSDPESRSAKLCAMVAVPLQGHCSRFCVCLTARLLNRVGRTAELHADVGTPEVIDKVHALVVNEVQDRHAYWLEARIDAILLDAVLGLASPAVIGTPAFRDLLVQLTRAGTTGGASLTAIDAVGIAGPVGSALPFDAMLRRLAYFPEVSDAARQWHVTEDAVERVIREAVCSPLSIKQLLVVSPAIESAGSTPALDAISRHVVALATMTEMEPRRKIATLLLFSEAADVTAEWLSAPSAEGLVAGLVESVLTVATSALHEAAAQLHNEESTTLLADKEWFLVRSDSFDIICAAAYQAVLRVKPHQWHSLPVHAAFVKSLDLVASISKPFSSASQELARMMLSRNGMRLAHSLLMAAVGTDGSSNCQLPLWIQAARRSTRSDVPDVFSKLMSLPPLHLSVADVPNPLAPSGGWGVAVAQYGRYVGGCLGVLLQGTEEFEGEGQQMALPADFVVAVGKFACDMLDECSQSNLSAAFDVLCWACRRCDDSATASRWLKLMRHRLTDEHIRREGHRCYATLGVTLVRVSAASDVAMDIISEAIAEEEVSDRLLYAIGIGMAATVVRDGAMAFDRFEDQLIQLAVFVHTQGHEEELDACLACTEAVLAADFWAPLKAMRPPSVGCATVARCAAVSAILHAASRNAAILERIVHKLLNMNESNPAILKSPCMPDSPTHRCRIRLWQLLVAMAPLLKGEALWAPVVDHLVNRTFEVINMGSVRRYMEHMLMAGINNCPGLYTFVAARLQDVDLRAQVCGSHALVAIHALKRHGVANEQMRRDLVPIVVRLCASHFHILRLTCQIGLHDLGQVAEFATLLSPEALAIVNMVEHNADCKKFRERHLDVVVFDDDEAITPASIFSTQRKEGDVWLHDSVAPVAFDRASFAVTELNGMLGTNSGVERFRATRLLRGLEAIAELRSLPLVPHVALPSDHYMRFPSELWESNGDYANKNAGNSESDNLQRKVTSWWNSEVHNELHPRALGTRTRQQLVVVATLLDYPVNVAGLCRCAEIFAVEKVVVADRKVFQNQQFVAVARSAELWLPWDEVPPGSLASYLATMKRLGYTIVGVEQTADSVPLQSYPFPERTVVVLGAEGTGIPANFLPCLDVCLEIPQFGLIRSLNVHVTGAVAMYEFTRQHLMEAPIA